VGDGGRGAVRAYEVKDASSLLRYSVVVFRPSRAVAVILADQRTAAFRYAGWRPRAPGEAGGGARKMKNPPADCSGRVCGGVQSVGSVATQLVSVH
jgi:hypothetical protein